MAKKSHCSSVCSRGSGGWHDGDDGTKLRIDVDGEALFDAGKESE